MHAIEFNIVPNLMNVFSRRHHPSAPALAINDLSFSRVAITANTLTKFQQGALTVNVTGTFTQPTTRKSGAALTLTAIDHFSLQRNGVEIQKLAPNSAGHRCLGPIPHRLLARMPTPC
jgi:hypothetical protein